MGEFIARFHPLAVHLPIGFILFAFAFEGIHVYRRTIDAHRKAVSLSYLLAFLASVITVWTGWLLAESALYQPEPLMQHKWAAIWVMMLSLLVFMIKWRPPGALTPWRSLAVSMILVLLVAMAGHLGGSLTHGRDYLWEKAPGWIRNMAGYQPGGPAAALAEAEPDSVVIYRDILMPVLHDKCVGCHNSEYQYAGLNLLDYADLFREGESGTPVVPGKVESSELFVRATLPQSDEKFMPPDAAGLSYTDLKILEYWIEQGADSSARFDNTTMPAELIELIRRDYNLDYAPRPYYEKVRADSLAAELLETVINSEYSVGYLGEDNFFVSVKFEGDTLTQDHAAALDAIKNNISLLDLSGSFIIDSSSLALSKFNNVVRIDLHGTNVTNDVFEDFSALKHLEVLNIYNTGVSDTGLEKILNAPSLRRVYIWKTSVTDEYLDGIRRAYPKTVFVSAFKFENVEVDTVEVE